MKVLLATGHFSTDHELKVILPQNSIEVVGECYDRRVLDKVIKELGADTVIISPFLKGQGELVTLIHTMRNDGIRVVVLPGNPSLPETKHLVKELVPLGVYDYVFDHVIVPKILHRLLNPASLGDIPKLVAASALNEQTLGEEMMKYFPNDQPKSKGLREKFQAMIGKKTKKDTSREETITNNMHPSIDNSSPGIGVLIEGRIKGYRTLADAKVILTGCIDAVFLSDDLDELLDHIKEIRRLVSCPLVVIGKCHPAYFEAGVDECFSALTPEVISIVKAKAKKIRALWNKANIDELTGCYQRNFMSNCFDHVIQKHKENGEKFSILSFDLNNFKQINDTYGHNTGDEVLRAFGEHLRRSCRKVDIPIRCGGDEFIIVVPNATKNMVLQIIERIKVTWQNNFEFPVTFSIGFAESGVDGETQEEILAAADLRMYEAKRQKKAANRSNIQNTVEFAKPKNKSNVFALLADSNEEGLAAFSIYMAKAASENGLEVVLIDCSLANPLIGPMLKVAKTKDWRVRGVNATVLINEIKILPLSKKVTDNHKVEEKLRDLIKELTLICKDSLLILNFGKGSPLLEVVQDFANILNFKINPNNYQYQLPSMDQWEKIPGEPDYVRDAAIINMVGRIRG